MEKLIPDLVAEMLFTHECVIIPGFGGFISRQAPAHIHPGMHSVHPPSKSVLFNKNLVNNDGLLANAIIERFQISYQDSTSLISGFAESAHRFLQQHQRLEFDRIGVLYLDTEKNIQFEPYEEMNFLSSSFGLGSVFARPVLRETEDVKREDRTVLVQDRKQPVIREVISNKKRPAWALAAVIAPAFLVLGFFIATSVAPPNSALASLNPFAAHEQPHYKQQQYNLPDLKEEKKNESTIVLNENGTGTLTLDDDMKNIVFVYVRDTVEVTPAVTKKSKSRPLRYAGATQHVSGNYQVVVGCFKDETNAKRLVETLHARSINAGITGTNANGLYVVSVGGFDTRDSANVLLQGIRENFPAAWLMKK
jgi:hypothetical protein